MIVRKKSLELLHLSTKRGITDVIGSLLLLTITVTGSVTLAYFMNDAFVSGDAGAATTSKSAVDTPKTLRLISYDTRDSVKLNYIDDLDNKWDKRICGQSCASNINQIPSNNGTEFLVFEVENPNYNPVFVHNVYINNVNHVWDPDNGGFAIDASADELDPQSYPEDGTFSMVSPSTNVQSASNKIKSGDIVWIVLKLNAEVNDIELNNAIHVRFNVGSIESVDFLIFGGELR